MLEKMETVCSPTSADLIGKYAGNGAVELPEDAATALEGNFGDLSQYALKTLAVEGYRSGALTPEQLHGMLSSSEVLSTGPGAE
jgi:hypothetical protein